MAKRKRTEFYRPHLTATVRRQAKPYAPVRSWLKRLQQLNCLWQSGWPGQELSSDMAFAVSAGNLAPRECYRFLACLGALRRTRLMEFLPAQRRAEMRTPFSESACDIATAAAPRSVVPILEEPAPFVPQRSSWFGLACQYAQLLGWAERFYRQFGLILVSKGLGMFDAGKWWQQAEKLVAATEFVDLPECSDRTMQQLTRRVRRLWDELDRADLFVALANLTTFFSEPADWERVRVVAGVSLSADEVSQQLDALQSRLAEVHSWLREHPEPFLLIDAYIQAVAAGFRKDLRRYGDLYLTATKYAAMLDALEIAEGVAPMFRKAARDLQAELACLRQDDVSQWYYPRSEILPPLLAAASGTAAPARILRWEAPDKRYRAAMLIRGNGVVLRFFTRRGTTANFLEGEQVYLAGVPATIDEDGWAIIPLEELLQSEEDLYLEVGKQRVRWRPLQQRTPN